MSLSRNMRRNDAIWLQAFNLPCWMIGATSAGFAELVMAGERIEVGMKMGKIQVSVSRGSSSGSKRPFNAYPKMKEGEVSVVHAHRGGNRNTFA